jgi:hypothetical protein
MSKLFLSSIKERLLSNTVFIFEKLLTTVYDSFLMHRVKRMMRKDARPMTKKRVTAPPKGDRYCESF